MFRRIAVASLLLAVAAGAQGQQAPPAHRWGGAVQVDFASGGEQITHVSPTDANVSLGQGITASGGAFYRPLDHPRFELQFLAGYKTGAIIPIQAGPYTDVNRWVFQVLADYRLSNQLFWGGGLVVHGHPKIYNDNPGESDIHFDDALGAVVEGGWNWVGVQCTYVKYHNGSYGTFDASNCGVRFTFHFRKWHPAN